jgi:DNA modification methylase
MQLWTKQGDAVLTPFLGIGSEAYTAVRMGRKAIGVELKASYFQLAARNMELANEKQYDIFGGAA